MKNLDRLRGAITASVLVAGSAAYAQEAEPTLSPPPQSHACETNPSAQAGECPPGTPGAEGQVQPQPQPQPHAQVTTPPPPPPPGAYAVTEPVRPWYQTLGFGLSLGGGVDSFVSGAYNDVTNIGGGWDLRATVGTRSWIALEAEYFGSAQSINALGLDNDAVLVGNGVGGNLRINVIPNYIVQPFVYGGAAWRHYDLTNEGINTSDIRNSDDVLEVPVGVGIAGYIGGFMADVRGEYRGAWFEDLIPFANDIEDNAIIGPADRWSVFGNIGAEF